MIKAFSAFLISSLSVATAFAVGDPPRSLNAQEAQATFAQYSQLLVPGCTGGQMAASGTVTGGAAPIGGSQTTTIHFDKGATVTVVTSWSMPTTNGSYANSNVTIKCSLNK